MSVLTDSSERVKFIRFGVVGIIGSIVDFGIFNLLATLIGLPSILSSVISFTAAVINNFFWNRLWTFPETRHVPVSNQLLKFSIVSVAGLAIRTPLYAWMEKLLIPLAQNTIPDVLTPTIVGHNLALAIAIGVVMLWNYIVNRLWTFKKVSQDKETNES